MQLNLELFQHIHNEKMKFGLKSLLDKNQFLNSSVNLNVTFNGSIALKTDVYGVSEEPHITAEESDLCQADSYPYQDYTQLQWVHALFILSYLLIIFLSVTGKPNGDMDYL